jgi:prevent-host-death family protein
MGTWQLQQAKAKLSEVIQTAQTDGPQIISQRGVNRAVVLPFDEWQRSQQSQRPSLLEILQSGPQFDLQIPPRGRWKMRRPVKF